MTRPDAQDALMSAGARGCAAFPSADVPEGVAEDVRRIAEAHGVELGDPLVRPIFAPAAPSLRNARLTEHLLRGVQCRLSHPTKA